MYIFRLLIFAIVFSSSLILYSQTLPPERAEEFIQALIDEDDNIESFVLPEELTVSKRFNIQYDNVNFKFLISYDIEPSIKEQLLSEQLDYEFQVENLQEGYSLLKLTIPEKNLYKEFYFKGDCLISPILYYTRRWERIESKHFIFYFSNPDLFNTYCVERLESFLNNASNILNYSEKARELLEKSKIHYFLCSDENETKKITGYSSRGMYNLAYDYIITTYNCHYHELMHLLINYKLQRLPLYTHPFLQEGFAVALGGRGGKEPKVILDLGLFLEQFDILHYSALLNKEEFINYDATLSYPLSGLYNYFLIKESGIEAYQKIYQKYSGNTSNAVTQFVSGDELPSLENWNVFLSDYSKNKTIDIGLNKNGFTKTYENNAFKIFESSTLYFFQTKDTILISTNIPFNNYQSKKFKEVFPNQNYAEEKYLVISNTNEISVYNLYTNNLIANYTASLTIPMRNVPVRSGYFEFFIQKDVFDEPLSQLSIKSN